jgi:hypothetical protein
MTKETYYMTKETYYMTKETCYMTKETYYMTKETYYMTKETYYMTKETYYTTKETCKPGEQSSSLLQSPVHFEQGRCFEQRPLPTFWIAILGLLVATSHEQVWLLP